MSGNRSQYTKRRSHADTLRLFGVPEWFDLKQYDHAREWTATRWLVETEYRVLIYSDSYTYTWFDRDLDWYKNTIKILYDTIPKPLTFKTAPNNLAEPGLPSIHEERFIDFGIKDFFAYSLSVPLIRPLLHHVEKVPYFVFKERAIDIIKGLLPSDNSCETWFTEAIVCRDLSEKEIIPQSACSIVSVDLNAPDVAIKKSFANWLEKERKRRKIPQPVVPGGKARTGKMGRPPTVGPQQRQAWARGYHLAYWDLRKLIPDEKLSLIEPKDWFDLLNLSDRSSEFKKSYFERAGWLLSDDANGLLRAEAEKESYRLTPHADDEGGAD